MRAVVPLGLVGATILIFMRYGQLGLNPTDQGYILAQSYGILHGAIPHVGLISPRPVGSALLHTIDFLIPLPLIEADRLTMVIEVVAYSTFCSSLLFKTSPLHWRTWQFLATIGSVLLSLNTFPMMSWHTIDGIFFMALGYLLVANGIARAHYPTTLLGCFFLGVATVMKQNFVIGPLSVFLLFTAIAARNASHFGKLSRAEVLLDLRRLVETVLCSVVPIGAYVVAMSLLGAFAAAKRQIIGAASPSYLHLLRVIVGSNARVPVALFTVAVLVMYLADRQVVLPHASQSHMVCVGLVARSGATLTVLYAGLHQTLHYGQEWSTQLFAMCAIALMLKISEGKLTDGPQVLGVLILAYTASLSWGVPVPDLLAGPLAVGAMICVWRDASVELPTLAQFGPVILAFATLVPTVAVFDHARSTYIYFDGGASQLTVPLRPIEASFGAIRTDPNTARYLADIKECLMMYPAARVAVLPDNPIIYPAFGLTDAFPISWLLPQEYAGSSTQILDVAHVLKKTGDYLVLFQTQAVWELASTPLRRATKTSKPFAYDGVLTSDLIQILGRSGTCGPFIVSYAPRLARSPSEP